MEYLMQNITDQDRSGVDNGTQATHTPKRHGREASPSSQHRVGIAPRKIILSPTWFFYTRINWIRLYYNINYTVYLWDLMKLLDRFFNSYVFSSRASATNRWENGYSLFRTSVHRELQKTSVVPRAKSFRRKIKNAEPICTRTRRALSDWRVYNPRYVCVTLCGIRSKKLCVAAELLSAAIVCNLKTGKRKTVVGLWVICGWCIQFWITAAPNPPLATAHPPCQSCWIITNSSLLLYISPLHVSIKNIVYDLYVWIALSKARPTNC